MDIELISKLISFRSTQHEPEQQRACADFVADFFAGTSYEVKRFYHEGVHSLVVTKPGVMTPKVFLVGHVLRLSGTTLGFGQVVTAGIANSAVTLVKMENRATQTFIGRNTAGTGVPEELSVATAKTMLGLSGTNTGDQTITLTGDVTGSGTASFAATISAGAVTYAKMQNISATQRLLGRNTAGAGVTEEVTATQVLDWATWRTSQL
jgi:hypothetical protein